MTVIDKIKGDAEQTFKMNEFNVKRLEEKLEDYTQHSKEAPAIISQSIQTINEAAKSNDQVIENMNDRIAYYHRVLKASQDDQEIFMNKLTEIHEIGISKKAKYQEDLEQQKAEQQEMENDLKTQIQSVLHQLKGLRGFQELRHQLDQQNRAVRNLIIQEKQKASQDITEIKHQITDQREFYENDLTVRLEQANRFAREFSDLHMDLVTTKIMNETKQNRKDLQLEEARTIELLRDNDRIRKQLHVVEQQHKINQGSVDSIHKEYSTLKLAHAETEKKYFESQVSRRDRIHQVTDEFEDKIDELKHRKEEALQRRSLLEKELNSYKKELQKAENSRSEAFHKECDVLEKMNQTATFILTAIDKVIGEENQTNEPSSVTKTKPREINETELKLQKNELSRLMQRLHSISQQMKETEIKNRNRNNSNLKDVETQTEKSIQSDLLEKDLPSAPTLLKLPNPRRKTTLKSFNHASPVYKRLLAQSKRPQPIRQTVLAQKV